MTTATMGKLRRSPFKVDGIESDPEAFGRRVEDVTHCAEALYNRRSVLISGPRGIGKSSLGSQLQTAYRGNNTLLRRCGIRTTLESYLCVFYACDNKTTLAQLADDLLYKIEREFIAAKSFRTGDAKIEFELNLGVFKTRIETEVASRRPATVATEFVAALGESLRTVKRFGLRAGICIMVDELDQLSPDINFAHFLKMSHETLVQDELLDVTFILAGQKGIYTRLLQEDPSVERMIRHVPISTLDPDEALYVLQYAGAHAKPVFSIDPTATEMLAALAAGYPYDLHLLGDAAFSVMQQPRQMTTSDVLFGVKKVLSSDKREKYIQRLFALKRDERLVIVSMARYSRGDQRIPMKIPTEWIRSNLLSPLDPGSKLDAVLESLAKSGHIIVNGAKRHCQFAEELFRIFISLLFIEQREVDGEKKLKAVDAEKRQIEQEFFADLVSGRIPNDDQLREALDVFDSAEYLIRLENAEYDLDWEQEDDSELTRF